MHNSGMAIMRMHTQVKEMHKVRSARQKQQQREQREVEMEQWRRERERRDKEKRMLALASPSRGLRGRARSLSQREEDVEASAPLTPSCESQQHRRRFGGPNAKADMACAQQVGFGLPARAYLEADLSLSSDHGCPDGTPLSATNNTECLHHQGGASGALAEAERAVLGARYLVSDAI